MKIFHWLNFKIKHNEQIKKSPDKFVEKLIEKTFELYPQVIDISDGELRGKKGFWSENLSDAWHNAMDLNIPYSEELDFMIWAVYCELHTKSRENFKKGIMAVNLSELRNNKVSRQYIKSWLKADIY